jgi:lysophospholipid acyltransferase (LPLAT)-like uncharacterized protein
MKTVAVNEGAERASKRAQRIARYGSWLVRLLSSTWRIRRRRAEIFDSVFTRREAAVFTIWHEQILPMLVAHKNCGVAVLISEHGDGEIIARMAERFGFLTVRGSSSRGASRALLELSHALEEGRSVAVTPDGPRGPSRSFAPGALIAAQRAGVPVIPIGMTVSRAWRLRSWDRFVVPKPFARVTIAYGDPVMLETTSPREAAEQTPRFQALMNEAEALAER